MKTNKVAKRRIVKPRFKKKAIRRSGRRSGRKFVYGYCDNCCGVGTVVMCHGCPSTFHLQCLDPPLTRDAIPTSVWFCKYCENGVKTRTIKKWRLSKIDLETKESETSEQCGAVVTLEADEVNDFGPSTSIKKEDSIIVAAKLDNSSELEILSSSSNMSSELNSDEMYLQAEEEMAEQTRDDNLNEVLQPSLNRCFHCGKDCCKKLLIKCEKCHFLSNGDCLYSPMSKFQRKCWTCREEDKDTVDQMITTTSNVEKVMPCKWGSGGVQIAEAMSTSVEDTLVQLQTEIKKLFPAKNPTCVPPITDDHPTTSQPSSSSANEDTLQSTVNLQQKTESLPINLFFLKESKFKSNDTDMISVNERAVEETNDTKANNLIQDLPNIAAGSSGQSELQESELQESELQESELQESELQESELQESELQESGLQESELQESELQENEIDIQDVSRLPEGIQACITPYGDKKGPVISLTYYTTIIGSGNESDVCLLNYGQCNYISKKHACLRYDDLKKSFELVNLSEHGTIVDSIYYGPNAAQRVQRAYSNIIEVIGNEEMENLNRYVSEEVKMKKKSAPPTTCICDLPSVDNLVLEDPDSADYVILQGGRGNIRCGCIDLKFGVTFNSNSTGVNKVNQPAVEKTNDTKVKKHVQALPITTAGPSVQSQELQKNENRISIVPDLPDDMRARARISPALGKEGPVVFMTRNVMSIGTGKNVDVCLLNYGQCHHATRKHACIRYDAAKKSFKLVNHSKNGTVVDSVYYGPKPKREHDCSDCNIIKAAGGNDEMDNLNQYVSEEIQTRKNTERSTMCTCDLSSDDNIVIEDLDMTQQVTLDGGRGNIKCGCIELIFEAN